MSGAATSLTVRVPLAIRRQPGRRTVVMPAGVGTRATTATRADPALVKALARAHRYQRLLDEGRYASISELADAEKVNRGYVGQLLRLTLLTPEVVENFLDGYNQPALDLPRLMDPFPITWAEQHARLGGLISLQAPTPSSLSLAGPGCSPHGIAQRLHSQEWNGDFLAIRTASDSLAQRHAERVALELVAKDLDLPALETQKRFTIGPAAVVVDAFAETATEVVLLEVNARVGTAMKTATRNKVLKDTLKLLLIEKSQAAVWQGKYVRKILVFLDPIARNSFGPKAWPNQAWDAFGVETQVCEIPEPHRSALIAAQAAQDLRSDLTATATASADGT